MPLTKYPTVSMVEGWIASGEYERASAALRQVQAEKPRSSELYRCWADLYLAQGCVELAEESAARAYKFNPQNISAVAALAECYGCQGQNARALGLVHPIADKQFNLRIMTIYCNLAAKGFGKDSYLKLHNRYCRMGYISQDNAAHLNLGTVMRRIDEWELRAECRALDPRRLVCRGERT